MTKFVLTITLAAISGLWVATHRDDTSHASAAVTPATLPATESPAEDEPQCDATTMSEDAASCSAGGWHAALTCCFTSSGALERYTRGTERKCCGPCFLP